MNRKKLFPTCAFLFSLGFFVGPVLDGIHVYSDTLAYRTPAVLRTAGWVFPLFGAAALGISLHYLLMDRILKRKRRRLTSAAVGAGLAYFVVAYLISGFWSVDSVTKSAVLAAMGGGALLLWDRTWQGLVEAVQVAATGCLVESLISSTGGFHYLAPDFLRIPYWLFFLYIPAAVAVGNLARKLTSASEDTASGS